MPPMAVDPTIRIPELKNVLKQYSVDGYFREFAD
jgi:cysteine desulfurase